MPIDPATLAREIERGLPNEQERRTCAQANRDYYEGHFAAWESEWRPPGSDSRSYLLRRHSKLFAWVVGALTRNLYRTGPARTLPDHDKASAVLNLLARGRHLDELWQQVDREAVWGGYAAIQVLGVADPALPVKFRAWGADECIVWTEPEDPTEVAAVAVLDQFDQQKRLRLWTAETLEEYRTTKLGSEQTSGGTAYRFWSSEPNPYGVIPFAFAFWDSGSEPFGTHEFGNRMREVNAFLNWALTDIGDEVRFTIRPQCVVEGVPADWQPPSRKPGGFVHLPSGDTDAVGKGPGPRIQNITAPSDFVGVVWADLQQYLTHTLECAGVPPAAFRMEQTSARSGLSIIAEQAPLLDWAEARQRPFARYEAALARVVLAVLSAHLRNNGQAAFGGASLAELEAAIGGTLALRWGRMWANLPGQARDASDERRLALGIASRVDLLVEREGLSREEAQVRLRQVLEDEAALLRERQALGLLPEAALPPPPEAAVLDDPTASGEAVAG